MGDWGIKISKPGEDVNSAGDKDLVFSTAFNTLKVAKIMEFTASGSSAHGMGYTPTFVMINNDTGNYMLGNPGYYSGILSMVKVDDTNVACLWNSSTTYVILFTDKLDES